MYVSNAELNVRVFFCLEITVAPHSILPIVTRTILSGFQHKTARALWQINIKTPGYFIRTYSFSYVTSLGRNSSGSMDTIVQHKHKRMLLPP